MITDILFSCAHRVVLSTEVSKIYHLVFVIPKLLFYCLHTFFFCSINRIKYPQLIYTILIRLSKYNIK